MAFHRFLGGVGLPLEVCWVALGMLMWHMDVVVGVISTSNMHQYGKIFIKKSVLSKVCCNLIPRRLGMK